MTTTLPGTAAATDLFDTNEIRIDGRDKVSGKMLYTADIRLPNMLWAAFTISPYAHAKIVSIDTTAAKAVPGVKAVLTAKDIGPKRLGRMLYDWQVLAIDKVVFIGDRVAAIAAETREAAEEAAQLVHVEYEELPALLDPFASLAPDAPVIHPDQESYFYAAKQREPRPHPNLQGTNVMQKGATDLEPLFAGAHRVFEHRFVTPRQHCGYLEPHATVVAIDDDGLVRVWSPNKSPFKLKEFVANVAGISADTVIVEPTAIGGDFGGKGLTIDEYPCYFLAKATGRPVKRVSTYVDELQSSSTRHRAWITLKTAVDRNGKFIAHHSDVVYDGGAYAAGKPGPKLLPGQLGYSTVGYQVPNVRLDIRCAYTNTIPGAHMRAPSDVQLFFAWEQHVEMIAEALGIDALELRMLNVMRDGDSALTDEPMRAPMGYAVLDALKRESRWGQPLAPGKGRGISFVCRHTGGGKTSLTATLRPDGRIDVLVGVPDQGSGSFTVVRRVMAATLGIDPNRISVARGNTSEARNDPGSGASRVTHIVGQAARVAADEIRAALEKRSGEKLDSGNFERLAGTLGEPLKVVGAFDGSHEGPDHPADFSFSAFAIEVDVDEATGAFRIEDTLLITDVGQIINPVNHQGQLDGGFIYGIGGALMEEMPIDESGKVTTLSLGEYKLPTTMDVPPLRTVLVRDPGGNGPYGAKMAGELSNSGVAPALVNAIYAALGVRLDTFPITSERIFEALLSKIEQAA